MSELQKTLKHAVVRILKPLVRILLRHGISHAEFSDLAKMVYVDVSEKDFQMQGRKQSVARICVLTGLHRKDVNQIKLRLANDDLEVEQLSRAARVINGWANDEDFQGDDGHIKVLALEGPQSFAELVKRFSGDMPVRAILDELVQSGCVRKTEDNGIELISTAYIPHESDEKLLHILGVSTADLLRTLDFNLNKAADEDSYLQMVVDYRDIPDEKIAEFKSFSEQKSWQLLKDLDRWLEAHGIHTEHEEKLNRVGFGLYFFQGAIETLGKNHTQK